MEVQKDFKELLESFNAHGVDYLIVGAFALAAHGAPRFTGDLDLWVKPNAKNGQKLLDAISEFGIAGIELTTADFTKLDRVVQLGVPPVRIDLLTAIDGVTWKQAWAGRLTGTFGPVARSLSRTNGLPVVGKTSPTLRPWAKYDLFRVRYPTVDHLRSRQVAEVVRLPPRLG